ncbi:MAG: hypothetical protein K2W96_00490 [Gemmataceae bacterium]|nr:hypothetical protein [Gemmataceae bacterium]
MGPLLAVLVLWTGCIVSAAVAGVERLVVTGSKPAPDKGRVRDGTVGD